MDGLCWRSPRDYSPPMTDALTVRRHPSPPPETMRRQRLSLLREPQELFVERLVAGGTTWLLEVGHDAVGYGVVASDGTLVEIFTKTGWRRG